MNRFGISVYPNKTSVKKDIEYIKSASKYNYSRIFTCLISSGDSIKDSIRHFKKIIDVGNSLNMEVIADITPKVFKKLNLTINDLSYFNDIGLKGIRLDLGFSGQEEALMTTNPYELKIEINMSNGVKYLENIISYQPKKSNLYGCHNFYPQKYTGLSRKHFLKCSKQFKKENIKTAAFVNSESAKFGPWGEYSGLSTLEEHRDLPIDIQGKDLIFNGMIDDIIIGNCYASDEELKKLSNIDINALNLKVNLKDDLSALEKAIILDEFHFVRGDISEYVLRSTQPRVKYKGHNINVNNTVDIKRGDILINNSKYNRYAGELQIALKERKNSGKTNVVGHITPKEKFFLKYIKPWQKFKFKEE